MQLSPMQAAFLVMCAPSLGFRPCGAAGGLARPRRPPDACGPPNWYGKARNSYIHLIVSFAVRGPLLRFDPSRAKVARSPENGLELILRLAPNTPFSQVNQRKNRYESIVDVRRSQWFQSALTSLARSRATRDRSLAEMLPLALKTTGIRHYCPNLNELA